MEENAAAKLSTRSNFLRLKLERGAPSASFFVVMNFN